MNQKWVAFLRIVIGLFFLAQGLNKLNGTLLRNFSGQVLIAIH